ncbi:hypothetical protein HK102_012937, partial [Quaeritorhiza haematococci]
GICGTPEKRKQRGKGKILGNSGVSEEKLQIARRNVPVDWEEGVGNVGEEGDGKREAILLRVVLKGDGAVGKRDREAGLKKGGGEVGIIGPGKVDAEFLGEGIDEAIDEGEGEVDEEDVVDITPLVVREGREDGVTWSETW